MNLRKIFALVSIVACFQTFALTPQAGLTELKKAYDALNFSIQVEWDQKDKKFYNKKVAEFHKEIKKLQKQGLSNAELINFVKSNIKDRNLSKNLDEVMNTIKASSMTQKEARKFALDYMSKNYSEGASWRAYNTGGVIAVALFLSIALALVSPSVAVVGGPSRTCVEEYVCDEYYDYYYNVFYEDCYYDTYCY